MIRLLAEDVTIDRTEVLNLHVPVRGGQTSSSMPRSRSRPSPAHQKPRHPRGLVLATNSSATAARRGRRRPPSGDHRTGHRPSRTVLHLWQSGQRANDLVRIPGKRSIQRSRTSWRASLHHRGLAFGLASPQPEGRRPETRSSARRSPVSPVDGGAQSFMGALPFHAADVGKEDQPMVVSTHRRRSARSVNSGATAPPDAARRSPRSASLAQKRGGRCGRSV